MNAWLLNLAPEPLGWTQTLRRALLPVLAGFARIWLLCSLAFLIRLTVARRCLSADAPDTSETSLETGDAAAAAPEESESAEASALAPVRLRTQAE